MTKPTARGQCSSRGSTIAVGDAELYPRLAQLGVVGDRRTAAVISADGTVRWLCLPDYDGVPVFGNLLDAERGGYWRLGPTSRAAGHQRYADDNNVLVTIWQSAEGEIELTDTMLSPDASRPWARRGAGHCCAGSAASAVPPAAQWS